MDVQDTVSLWRLCIMLCGCVNVRQSFCSATGTTLTLEDYVNRPDPTYTYTEVYRSRGFNHNAYFLNMTSQKWMDETFSNRPIWWHDMVISVPTKIIDPSVAFIYIGSGSNEPESISPSGREDTAAALRKMSQQMRTVVCHLKQIPNQPIVFKAVVRAMDTVTDFTGRLTPALNITRFVIAGLSKHLQRHQQSLGGWSFAMYNYYVENITRYLDHPRFELIMDLIDPYSSIRKYTVPTMIVDGTGDQFFLPDASHIFFNELPGPKYFQMMPDHDHSLEPMKDVMNAMIGFTIRVITGYGFPKVSWKLIETATGGKIELNSTGETPQHVRTWFAHTDSHLRRDFRANFGLKATESYVDWSKDSVSDQGGGIYVAEFETPTSGWLGFLVEAVYKGPLGNRLTLTSEVYIIPNTFPFPPCYGEACFLTLV
ncbi:hypothetical protein NP493_37g05007 [Ridgeia piscesae]|uniref:Uncharacterized protein n=1 Tax=Ridgeia piscesae TaxID=27915 RepID=A0AAD9PCA1_RIDPI|nr:hypothetical protein NP493_37g05007 [Ridgeia piscesae]